MSPSKCADEPALPMETLVTYHGIAYYANARFWPELDGPDTTQSGRSRWVEKPWYVPYRRAIHHGRRVFLDENLICVKT